MIGIPRIAKLSLEQRAPRALVMQLILSALLLAAAPYAASMEPFQRIFIDGSYDAPHSQDPLFLAKAGLVAGGLLIPVVSVLLTVTSWRRWTTHPGPALLQSALLLLTFVVGWRNYPYWATGVYRAYISHRGSPHLDPAGLIPATWIDPLWGCVVLLLYPITAVAVLLLGACLFHERKRMNDEFFYGALTALLGAMGAFASTPDYMVWFLD
ncbi:hypothetical protein [Hyalangium minutum]|nr:hypothetical protein [Hyalangium minutum]